VGLAIYQMITFTIFCDCCLKSFGTTD